MNIVRRCFLLLVGGGGRPRLNAALTNRFKGLKGVGGGGRLKLSGRLGRRLAIEFADGTRTMRLLKNRRALHFFYSYH
jgi:hypothetical protein